MKNDHFKGDITTKYIDHKHKNTRTSCFAYPDYSVLIHPRNIEKQYH